MKIRRESLFKWGFEFNRGVTSLLIKALPFNVEPVRAYSVIAAGSTYSFWLDSAMQESPMSRFTYIGVVPENARVLVCDNAAEQANSPDDFARTLKDSLAQAPQVEQVPEPLAQALLGGYVGYLGYEFRAQSQPASPVTHRAETPDALWMPALRYLIHDHVHKQQWLVGDSAWLEQTRLALQEAAEDVVSHPGQPLHLSFTPPDRASYTELVRQSQQEIFEGNSYEVCLTANSRAQVPGGISKDQALATYLQQRAYNPAPYAAFLHCDDFYILSSSPERFLSVTSEGQAETKPIKGTVPRAADPVEDRARASWLKTDPKTRAENLMIVDLLRNDLSRVSQPGSVEVPVLMGVETYATVHQLVSTVRSQLRPGLDAVDAILACFPGGSMTGAPKVSSMDIIDRLEGAARGVYSGALGFFSASGAANLSIVIRTLVLSASGAASLGAGGAIVADSDPDAEYEEMLTKLAAAVPH